MAINGYRSLGIPMKIVGRIQEWYTNTVSCVRMEGKLTQWFEIKSGVRQGCTIAPSLFLTSMDWILVERTVHITTDTSKPTNSHLAGLKHLLYESTAGQSTKPQTRLASHTHMHTQSSSFLDNLPNCQKPL